jgi:formate dehydrogenase major subunit
LRNNRGRLTEPLVRENGSLRPATWDEALDVAATGLARAREQEATRSFGMFSCSKASNEVNFLA